MTYEGNVFLLSWDMLGLDSCVNITNIERDQTWATLQDQKPERRLSSVVNAVLLRARYNTQRHYEVYTVTMGNEITEEDVIKMFEENPQAIADLIRERGNKMFSARLDTGAMKIK